MGGELIVYNMEKILNYINGELVEPKMEKYLDNFNPFYWQTILSNSRFWKKKISIMVENAKIALILGVKPQNKRGQIF